MPDLSSSWEFCGDFHTGLFGIPRPLRISAESEPPDLSLWSFAHFVGSAGFPAWLPCRIRKLSVTNLYTARLYVGDDPLATGGWRAPSFARRWDFGVIAHPLRSGGTSQPPGSLSLSEFIIAHFLSIVKTFFLFFFIFFTVEEDYSSSRRRACSSSHSPPWISKYSILHPPLFRMALL